MLRRRFNKLLLVFGGICTALSIILLTVSTYIHINTFAILALCSALVGVVQIEGGTKYSLLTFFSTSVLLLVMPVDRLNLIYYAGFFGYYPVIKFFVERLSDIKKELVIKTVIFLILSFLGVWILKDFLSAGVSEKINWKWIALLGVVLMHVYDYALSIFFAFYEKKIRNKIRR